MSNDVPWQQLIEAIRENTEQVRKLNELLRACIHRDMARIRAEDQEEAHG